MMQDLYSALSHTERTLLDLELEQSDNANIGSPMSQSWVDIRTSPPRAKPKTHSKPQSGGISTPISTPLNSSRGTLRFGGASSQQTPQDPVAALYKATTATDIQPSSSSTPILPLFSSVNRPAPRKPNPLTVGSSTPIRSSLVSSSARGSPFLAFDSASKRSNAFYQPASSNTQNKTRLFSNGTAITRPNGQTDGDSFEHIAPEETTSFDYSLFSGSRPTNENTSIASVTIPSDSSARAAPPGAFDHDADDEDDDSRHVEQDAPARHTRSHRVSNVKSPLARKTRSTKSTTKTKEVESSEAGSRPSIPGSWDRISDSEDVVAEEEGDSVAPLPASAPPTRAKRGRASVASSETDDGLEEGKRRRSTRLSTASGEISNTGRKTKTQDKEGKDSGTKDGKSKKTSSRKKR